MKANVPQYVLKDSKYSSFFNKVSETVYRCEHERLSCWSILSQYSV